MLAACWAANIIAVATFLAAVFALHSSSFLKHKF